MFKQLKLIRLTAIIGALLFSAQGFSATNDEWVNQFKNQLESSYTQANSDVLSKDAWAQRITARAPAAFCQKFAKNKITNNILTANSIDNDKCVTIMSENLNQCIKESSATIPTQIDKSNQGELNKKMSMCAVEKFLSTYGNVSKDLWLEQFQTEAPPLLCQNFVNNPTTNNMLQANHIDVAKCETLIPKNVSQCVTEFSPKLPTQMNLVSDTTWANEMGNCSAKQFFIQYGGNISKVQWQDKLQTQAPAILCKNLTTNLGTNKLLTTNNIDYTKCLTLITPSLNQCATKFSASAPTQMKLSSGIDLSNQIGACTVHSFLKSYGGISKKDWLASIKARAPEALCQKLITHASSHNMLTAKKIDYQRCVILLPASLDQCIANYSTTLPAQITASNESEWGKTMGQCTLKDFYSRYMQNK